jgi:hypothetical protein
MGSRKGWHFQHHVEDANCNPQPMTLLHAFVRDAIAKRNTLEVPALRVRVELDVFGEMVHDVVTVGGQSFRFTSARTELRIGDVQPDVVFELENTTKLALEVRYSHAVDEAKVQRLHSSFPRAIELNVSDLPAQGISSAEVERLLGQAHRWRWLVNGDIRHAESRARIRHEWARTVWRAGNGFKAAPVVHDTPLKLKKAQQRLPWARTALKKLRTWVVHLEDAADWLGEQDRFDRVAVACAALGLDPVQLPGFMRQQLPKGKPPLSFGGSPHRWQPLVFMKFCVGKTGFSAHDADAWCRRAVPDLCTLDNGGKSLNGFARTAAALQLYFLQLQELGLVTGTGNSDPEARTFRPRFESPRKLRQFLLIPEIALK